MLNNDILRQLRYILDISDYKMLDIFRLADVYLEREDLLHLLKKDDDPDFSSCNDKLLEAFLDGLIVFKRGKREEKFEEKDKSKKLKKLKKLTNNEIFKKLRIAFSLRDDDIIKILKIEEVMMSKSELSAFFRSENNSNYRECKDQFLRKFLRGLTYKYRPFD